MYGIYCTEARGRKVYVMVNSRKLAHKDFILMLVDFTVAAIVSRCVQANPDPFQILLLYLHNDLNGVDL